MSNPFDIVDDISYKKQRLIHDEETEKLYVPFLVNRSFSYFGDTLFYAQEMNRYPHLDKKLQYDYLYNSLRKSKRYSKRFKKQMNSDIEAIQEYFQYSYEKAKYALRVLTKDQIKQIKLKLEKGGAS